MSGRSALEFIENCSGIGEITTLRDMLFREMSALGYAYVACCSHVDPLRPPEGAVSMINYPEAWLQRFSEENFASHDPIFLAARRSPTPFFWKDIAGRKNLNRRQRNILRDAASVGLEGGFTIPIHAPGALPASCSLVPGPDGVDPLQIPAVFLMSVYAHATARRLLLGDVETDIPVLSPRERQCLSLAGTGKSDWMIGGLLDIAPRTVHNAIERAKKRYGVAHRVQAVVRALLDGQIAIDDLSE